VTSVAVTDAGLLVLTTTDGVTLQPITVADAQALAAAVPQAENAAAKTVMTQSIRTLTDVLLMQGDGMSATVQVSPTAITASVDAETFAAACKLLGLKPDADGALVLGPVTVTTPAPAPTPTTGTA
jgi:hypothetical protein